MTLFIDQVLNHVLLVCRLDFYVYFSIESQINFRGINLVIFGVGNVSKNVVLAFVSFTCGSCLG